MNLPPPPPASAAPSAGPSAVMLLSLWASPPARWHARLMGTDAQVHEFDSPFELARFVARSASPLLLPDTRPAQGLR